MNRTSGKVSERSPFSMEQVPEQRTPWLRDGDFRNRLVLPDGVCVLYQLVHHLMSVLIRNGTIRLEETRWS